MGRRFGMWTAMICVLVVGVSVTKMTNDFVSSNGVEAAAIANVMDTSIPLTSGMGAVESAVGTFTMKAIDAAEETVEETVADYNEAFMIEEEILGARAVPTEEDVPLVEGTEEVEEFGPGMEEFSEPLAASLDDGAAVMSAFQSRETVKSPLDPVVIEEGPYTEEIYENSEMNKDYFLDRFASVEASTAALWDMVTPENSGAYYTAAEQEHVFWEHELNLIYSTVRDRLSDEETEELNISEMEWMKERDRYANQTVSSAKNKAAQSADYLQALTLMTKERCFWFLDVYHDVLELKD